jgi:TRAP-type C4-dicarboxylate transport system permease small subunit
VTTGVEARPGHHVPADFPAVVRALAALSRLLAVLEGIGIGACLGSLIGLATFQFVSRNLRQNGQLWMPLAPDWIDGVIRHSVFLLGFLGAAYATFTGRHIRIDAVTRMLRPRARMGLRMVTALAAVGVCGVLLRAGYEFYQVTLEEAGEVSQQGQVFTSARGALVMMGGFLLVAFHFLVQVAIDAVWVVTGREPPAVWVAEASHGEGTPVREAKVESTADKAPEVRP